MSESETEWPSDYFKGSDSEEEGSETHDKDDDGYDSKWSAIAREQDLELRKGQSLSENHKDEDEPTGPSSQTSKNSNSNSNSSSQRKKHGKKGKKTFGLPFDRPGFQTFIDHGTTLDAEGYPLLPNGSTVFVKQPNRTYTNWCSFGFSSTTSGGGKKEGFDWRTVRFTCLGVTMCNNRDCDFLGAPPTSNSKRAEWETKSHKCPAAMCPDYLRLVPCVGTICRVDEHLPSGWVIVRHSGIHKHPWPRRSKPDKLALATFALKVVENPDLGPLQHKVGQAPAGKTAITTSTDIHPALSNLHRLGYYRRILLVQHGIIPVEATALY
ncbi:uncharacterized protein MELLADRAFT_88379 [Melampsora larici-populina 98AG31]|uniref:GCM domain-containing protein n=1 Tax=Melampsora larici-populina (strain 98AG31 / pathotype 3-4-7) TaxID=747676 RepID=F4RRI2_MELLP|nr:uncharacterized protein MELLADRAFT_88379 [Melampsora larici-populina 98AG31]EGG05025.1 hypothetical protein MELLADRAFT_88379 [Melampsora larici-populina 98AG31]